MIPNIFAELKKLRNMSAHGLRGSDSELATRLAALGLSVSAADLPDFGTSLLQCFGREDGLFYVPQTFLFVLEKMIDGISNGNVCDPCAGLGIVLKHVQEVVKPAKTFAFTQNEAAAKLGNFVLNLADWHVGDPFQLINTLPDNIDIVASILPFGVKANSIRAKIVDGTELTLDDDLGHSILAASSMKLSAKGLGLFVVTPSFFFSKRSVLRQFEKLGLGVTAALALPSGTFAPYTNISTYLIVVKKQLNSKMFVAQLSTDANTNLQIIENFKCGQAGASLELGCFVDILKFTGISALRSAERLEQAERNFNGPAARLGDLAADIKLGRSGDDFSFSKNENAVFVPLIGNSDVTDSLDNLTMKLHNYAQITIDPTKSDAQFVARFLNSELGKEIREHSKPVCTIPKFNTNSLKNLIVFIPDLNTQKEMLSIEARITNEQNTLSGLQNEINECHRNLWANPNSRLDVAKRIENLSKKLSADLKQQVVERLDQWFETLPFPMASILRAWQATPSNDYKTKYEHLLHFFEASAEFIGIIILSAFSSREQFYAATIKNLVETLAEQKLSFKRATFGTWKVVIENLGKQVRQMLSGDKDQRAMCADMFADNSMQLSEVLSSKELVSIISKTNTMRNNWTGHTGAVGQDEAQRRNGELLSEIERFRETTVGLWSNVQLVHALHCFPRRGMFENEVAILMGSNSEFLKETRTLTMALDVEQLYLNRRGSLIAMQIMPLVQVGPSPSSTKNACYFFSRIEKNDLRYVSYHFIDQPERMFPIKDMHETISLLLNV